MAEMNLNGQHKKVLFLISLPPKWQKDCNKHVSHCMNELDARGVEVRKSICKKDLKGINKYDLVIVISHYDTDSDSLILYDGWMPMSSFIESLPKDFSGILDVSSCYSADSAKLIKAHAPNCMVQAAVGKTALEVRLLMYPFIIDYMYVEPNRTYNEVYVEVLNKVKEYAHKNQNNEGKETTKLGTKFTVGAPYKVERDYQFVIMLALHYNTKKGVKEAVDLVKGALTKKLIRNSRSISINKGEIITATLNFEPEITKHYIQISGEKKISLTWNGNTASAGFSVMVKSDFPYKSFNARISLKKGKDIIDDNCLFLISVIPNTRQGEPAKAVVPQKAESLEDILAQYSRNSKLELFDSKVITNNKKSLLGFSTHINNKELTPVTKLGLLRDLIHNYSFYLVELETHLSKLKTLIGKVQLNKDNSFYVKMSSSDQEIYPNALSRLIAAYSKGNKVTAPITAKHISLLINEYKLLQEEYEILKKDVKDYQEMNEDISGFKGKHDNLIEEKLRKAEKSMLTLMESLIIFEEHHKLFMAFLRLKTDLENGVRIADKETNKTNIEVDAKKIVQIIKNGADKGLFDKLMSAGKLKDYTPNRNNGYPPKQLYLLIVALAIGKYEYKKDKRGNYSLNVENYYDWSEYVNTKNGSKANAIYQINSFVCHVKENAYLKELSEYRTKPAGIGSLAALFLEDLKVIII